MPTHSDQGRGRPDEAPDPPVTPPIQTEVAMQAGGGQAAYALQMSNRILNTKQLESDDTLVSDREAEGTLSQGDTDVYVGKAGVLRAANASDSAAPLTVAIQGKTYEVAPGEVLALRFVPGPAGPIELPEEVLGVPSDAAAAGGLALGAVGLAEMTGVISLL